MGENKNEGFDNQNMNYNSDNAQNIQSNMGPSNFTENNYSAPVNAQQNNKGYIPKEKNSELGKWALALSLLGCTSFIGLILAIIDIAKKDGRKKTFSFAALGVCGVIFLLFGVGQISNLSKRNKTTNNSTNERVAGDDTIPVETTTEKVVVETEATTLENDSQNLNELNDDNYVNYERTSEKKNGFDSSTNKKEVIDIYQFEIPSYFGNHFENKDGNYTYIPLEKENEYATLRFFFDEYNKDEISMSELNDAAEEIHLQNYTSEELGQLSGKKAYMISGKNKMEDEETEIDGRQKIYAGTHYVDQYVITLLDSDNNKAIYILLTETLGTNYDYYDDVLKICDSMTYAEGSSVSSSGVSSDFKDMLDAYEEFMDEYIEFMEKYNQNPTDAELMSEYMDIMIKYNNYVGTISKLDESEMTDEEAAYYLEVTSRVTQKLLEAGMSN